MTSKEVNNEGALICGGLIPNPLITVPEEYDGKLEPASDAPEGTGTIVLVICGLLLNVWVNAAEIPKRIVNQKVLRSEEKFSLLMIGIDTHMAKSLY
jgi:hypothetical protein